MLTSRAIGFSQKIAFPARAERSIRSAWVSVGEQMATASTSFEPRISSTDAGFAPVSASERRGGAGIGVGDVDRLAVASRGDVAAMDLSDAPCADDAEFHARSSLTDAPKDPSGTARSQKKNIRSILTWE